MKINEGQSLLINDKEYIVTNKIKYGNKDYICVVSNFKPLEIEFYKINDEDNKNDLEYVSDIDEKKSILKIMNDK